MNERDTKNLPDQVDTCSAKAWRISQGKILRGRKGEEEERGVMLGYLRRIGTHYGTLDDGRAYAKLECDLETNRGMETVGASLLNPETGKPTLSSCISLAEGLLECAAGELVQIEAVQGSKVNRFGSLSTYARVTRIDPATLKAVAVEKRERNGDFDERYLDELVGRLGSHPAFAVRPRRDSLAATTHRSLLDEHLVAKGWPTTCSAPEEWLAACNKMQHGFCARIEDVPDDVWGEARLALQDRVDCPKFLLEARDRLAGHDPFAEPQPAPGALA